MEFTFKSLLQMIAKRWWIALVSVVICFSITYTYTSFFVQKEYSSKVVIKYGYSDTKTTSDEGTVVLSCSPAMLGNVYLEKLATNLLEKYGDEGLLADTTKLDNTYSGSVNPSQTFAKKLSKMLQIKSDKLTFTVAVTVVSTSAKDAYLIAKEIVTVEMLKELSSQVGKAESDYNNFKSIEVPFGVKYTPISPNVTLNSIVGILIGIILGILLIILFTQLDVSVKDEEDLLSKYNLPVLGVIPSFPDIEEVK